MGLLNAFGFAARPKGDVEGLYAAIVAQARLPEFYLRCGVPDTVPGRFDMVALHAYIVLRRLKELGAPAARQAQALFDRMFLDFDHNLREIGVGDLAVGHRIKDLAKSFYGRIKAYDEGLAGDGAALEAALGRNAFAETAPAPAQLAALALYLRGAVADSRRWTADTLARAEIAFPPPPRLD